MFGNILSSLMNTFKSDDISDTLIDTRNRIRDGALEVVQSCIQDTQNVDFSKNMEYKSTLAAIHRNYPRGTAKLELFQAYGLILNNCDKHLDELIGLVTKYFTKTVDKDSMTYARGQIMALGKAIDFVGDFIPKHCRYVIVKQNELAGGLKAEKVISRGQINYIKENTVEFYKALVSLASINIGEIEKMLKEIPDVVISEDGAETKMFKQHKLDPSGTLNNFLSASTNPFYYIGMAIVDYQHNKYKLAKEEVESIKIELEAMNSQLANGQVDAYTERQRDLAIERMQKLEYQISKYEEKARNTQY